MKLEFVCKSNYLSERGINSVRSEAGYLFAKFSIEMFKVCRVFCIRPLSVRVFWQSAGMEQHAPARD